MEFILNNLSVSFAVLAFLGPLVHIKLLSIKVQKKQINTALSYILFFGVGCQGVYAFLGHAFFPTQTAASIGWTSENHFQLEIAFANLAFGILAFLATWNRGGFRLATVIGVSIYLLGAALGHIWDVFRHLNFAPNNAGLVLFLDLFIPLILIFFMVCLRRNKKKSLFTTE